MIERAAATRPRAGRGVLIALALLIGTGLLAGCSSLSFLTPPPAEMQGPAAAASAPINSDRAEYRIDVQAPDALRGMLQNYLDLARFQDAPATEGINAAELERLVRAAPAQARGLLETEGYFNADVKVTREDGPNGLPLLRVVVNPGPRTTVASFRIEAKFDAADEAAGRKALEQLRAQWPLQPGQPFRQSTWNDAKSVTLARLRSDGYASASWRDTSAVVDAANNSVKLELDADSGPLYQLGEIRIEGLERYGADSVRQLATFRPG
jgi:translocation and assembly module TamA